MLSGAAARQQERHWLRGLEGELDDARLVDALAGEAKVFKRRQARPPRPGEPPTRPKRALFLFDASASMYRFNGVDGRLRRSCETVVMIMEALQGRKETGGFGPFGAGSMAFSSRDAAPKSFFQERLLRL